MGDTDINKTMNDIKKIVIDFIKDILLTFPEQKDNLNAHLQTLIDPNAADTDTDEALAVVYAHCKKVYPERFFDILYQNNEAVSYTHLTLPTN